MICYYPSDVGRICDVLSKEFEVHKSEDTVSRLAPQEFGYRSTHLVISIKQEWLQAPSYRGLTDLKAEVQVRTVLMHAWAEIQHKLAYKKYDQVPDQFRRKLYRLSAKFEEADEQFDEIRAGLASYRESLRLEGNEDLRALREKALNLDTLQAFLDVTYPDREKGINATRELLEELQNIGLTLGDVVDAVTQYMPIIEKAESHNKLLRSLDAKYAWTQVGAARNALDTVNEKYYQHRLPTAGAFAIWRDQVEFSRSLVNREIS